MKCFVPFPSGLNLIYTLAFLFISVEEYGTIIPSTTTCTLGTGWNIANSCSVVVVYNEVTITINGKKIKKIKMLTEIYLLITL
ncbi:MAG: hypothetical protein ACJA0H_001473 [Francisellaceae bacterium]|jgi:hypothetical protein